MQISIIDVGSLNTHSAKNGRQYQSLEVTYKNEQGQAQSKKLMSFSAPDVFKAAQGWTKGDSVNVSTKKDDNGYWQWMKILEDGEIDNQAPAAQAATTQGAKPVAARTSNYETPEERAARQVMIVRQSSLSNAVATLALERNQISTASANDIISLAKLYEGYVLGNTGGSSFDDLQDDILI